MTAFNPIGGGALRTNEPLSRSSDSKQLEDITQKNKARNDISIIPNHLKENGIHSVGCRKVAFTLAEVLITIGIIGVVAAMTLPSLITKYKEKKW